MRSLVALDMPASENFVVALHRIWDSGDAVLPIDQRLPQSARVQLATQLGASSVIAADSTQTSTLGGSPVEDDDALVIATSGSTGTPKGVVHTHASLRAATIASGTRLGCSVNDHWLACIPLAHVGGFSVVLRALHYGSTLSIAPRADADSIRHALSSGATMTSLVPAVLQRVDVSGFRTVLIGGGPVTDPLPANAIMTYGLSETVGGVVYDGVPLDGVEIRIDDNEIHLRGGMLLRCYRDGNNPKTSAGWFPTGDLGQWDASGHLVVHGRGDDLIITGGNNVWPITVENALRTHKGVADVAVRGLPDPKWGSRVVAWIVTKNGMPTPTLDELRDHVKQSLPNYCAPQACVFVNEISRTALGKVRVSDLHA